MLFNSLEFFIFFLATLLVYYVVPHRFRWVVLLLSSYVFYASWQANYLIILILVTLVSYLTAIGIGAGKSRGQRTVLLALSVSANLGALIFFKYFNFFNDTFRSLFTWIGVANPVPHLEIILPVGISFFTLQAVSYSMDVFRGEISPERHIGNFAVYLAFFPKLIAGPIERAGNILPQFYKKRSFDPEKFFSGMQLMSWGFFKKVVIADRLGIYVDMVFKHPQDYHGKTLILAIYFFAVQIYCDFSGYTDIARGCARMMGLELMENFRFPYFARSIREFWRRWHISLTTWFRDYLYIPLGGNRVKSGRWRVNVLLVFLVSGFWHGANWTFILWGALHGFYYLAGRATAQIRTKAREAVGLGGSVLATWQVLFTFTLVAFAWVLFRANSLEDAIYIFGHLFTNLSAPMRWGPSQFTTALTLLLTSLFVIFEIFGYLVSVDYLPGPKAIPLAVKYPVFSLGLIAILLFGVSGHEFIYFHF